MNSLIGRTEKQEILLDAFHSNEAEMVAVIGRRQVGKTFLISKTYFFKYLHSTHIIPHISASPPMHTNHYPIPNSLGHNKNNISYPLGFRRYW